MDQEYEVVALRISPGYRDWLNDLQVRIGGFDHGQVLENAVSFYKHMLDAYEAGDRIYVEHQDGTLSVVTPLPRTKHRPVPSDHRYAWKDLTVAGFMVAAILMGWMFGRGWL